MVKYNKSIIALLACLITFVTYVITLNPAVTFMDSGELAGALYTFGIPHPTGYPLYLLIGYLTANLPFGGSAVYKLNLLSAVFSSAAVIIFYFAVIAVLKLNPEKISIKVKKSAAKKKHPESPVLPVTDNLTIYLIAFFTALIIGLSRTFWYNALSAEVYPLHELFVCIILYLCIKIYSLINRPEGKLWTVLFLILGLSFANHMTTVLLLPGLIYLAYLQVKANNGYKSVLLKKSVFIVPGLLLYSVLIVRASAVPFFNWSDPRNLSNLIHHLSGSDFDQLIFSSGSAFTSNLKLFTGTLPEEFAYIGFITGLFGLYISFKNYRNLFILFIIISLSSIIYALNYNIRDVQVYFIIFYIVFGLFIAFGLRYFIEYLKFNAGKSLRPAVITVIAGFILVLSGYFFNFEKNNYSDDYVIEDLALNTMNTLDENAVYVTYDWGYSYPAALYYSRVNNIRTDLKIFNIKFFSVKWYLEMIIKYYPDIYNINKTDIDEYLKSTESDNKKRLISLTNLVKNFFLRTSAAYPVYVSYDLLINKDMKQVLSNFNGKPCGYYYKLVEKNEPYDSTAGVKCLDPVFRKYDVNSAERKKVNTSVAGMLFETGFYHYKGGNYRLALNFLDKSISINNQIPDAINLKNRILSETK